MTNEFEEIETYPPSISLKWTVEISIDMTNCKK